MQRICKKVHIGDQLSNTNSLQYLKPNIWMSGQVFGAGRNIKCFDKIKIMHRETTFRIHNYKDKVYDMGSGNSMLSCHKARNDTDWFVVSSPKPQNNNPSHLICNSETIILTHMQTKKNMHVCKDFESPASKQAEVSLCGRSGSPGCLEDHLTVELVFNEDEYWRVGEPFRLICKNTNAPLYCQKKKLPDSSEWEVFSALASKQQAASSSGKTQDVPTGSAPLKASNSSDLIQDNNLWVICEHEPYLYTAPVSSRPHLNKNKEEQSQLQRLKQQKLHRQTNKKTENISSTGTSLPGTKTKTLISSYNSVLTQIEEKKKPFMTKRSWWKKYLCCCFFRDPEKEFYQELMSQ